LRPCFERALPRAGPLLIAGLLIGGLPSAPHRTDPGAGSHAALAQEPSGSVVVRRLRSATGPQPRIVNGVRAGGFYPTTGMIFRGSTACSGTLIGCNAFLTAAHCVDDPVPPESYNVFLQHFGFVAASSVTIHPDSEFGVRSDIAVVELASPVAGVSPSMINTDAEPPLGTLGDIVGFGSVGELFGPGTSSFFAGIKRRGDVITAECDPIIPDDAHVCWDFEVPVGPPGEDSNTCKGDSGGPLFADVAGLGVVVAGVTSGGTADCLPNETPFDADVAFDHEWIESFADELGPSPCGLVPPVFGPGSIVLLDQFGMDTSEIGVVYPFDVPVVATMLHVTINGELIPAQNYDLYVKHGGPPTVEPPDFDCASTHGNSFETCSFASPAAGEWFILVDNPTASEGEFDVTVSLVGSPFDADANEEVTIPNDGVLLARYLFTLPRLGERRARHRRRRLGPPTDRWRPAAALPVRSARRRAGRRGGRRRLRALPGERHRELHRVAAVSAGPAPANRAVH
jgi:Trypsin/Bacterial pre-peptidase C-terminal domain